MKTIEELEAEIELHTKANADYKVGILKKQLKVLLHPEDSIDKVSVERVGYDMHQEGREWKEIQEVTGMKAPWISVKKYAKENELPYG